MKNTRKILSVLLIALLLAVSLSGCYIVSGQKMKTVKGTYKLTTYTYTPSHERKNGQNIIGYDYVNSEEYKYEDYLIVTGGSTGYYVHKDASGDSYIKEITLRYEYDTEDSSKVNYVIYNDSVSVNRDDGGTHRLGVSKDSFNYYKAAFDYTELITKREMRTEELSVRWEKVSRATDLSYVTEQLGNLKYYDYQSFAKRGIYELTPTDAAESQYLYFFCVIDTAKDSSSATLYYQMKDVGEQVKESVEISTADAWGSFTISGSSWTQTMSGTYTTTYNGEEFTSTQISHSIKDSDLGYFIENRLPKDVE